MLSKFECGLSYNLVETFGLLIELSLLLGRTVRFLLDCHVSELKLLVDPFDYLVTSVSNEIIFINLWYSYQKFEEDEF